MKKGPKLTQHVYGLSFAIVFYFAAHFSISPHPHFHANNSYIALKGRSTENANMWLKNWEHRFTKTIEKRLLFFSQIFCLQKILKSNIYVIQNKKQQNSLPVKLFLSSYCFKHKEEKSSATIWQVHGGQSVALQLPDLIFITLDLFLFSTTPNPNLSSYKKVSWKNPY